MPLLLRVLLVAAGGALVGATLLAAIRTFVVPRSQNVWLTRWVFVLVRGLFDVRARRASTYAQRDGVEESHTSLSVLAFFRSPQPDHSWVTAAGAVLDGAALRTSIIDLPPDPQADLCIRAGYLCLRRIADMFRVPYDPDPRPDAPISIAREEFDDAYDRLREHGVPLKVDRDAAWRAFAGWRVNYDSALVGLAELIMAPEAPWSSDRGLIGVARGRTRAQFWRYVFRG